MPENNKILREAETAFIEIDLAQAWGIGPMNNKKQLLAKKAMACFNEDGSFASVIKYYSNNKSSVIYDETGIANNGKAVKNIDNNIAIVVSNDTDSRLRDRTYKWIPAKDLISNLKNCTSQNIASKKSSISKLIKEYSANEVSGTSTEDKASSNSNSELLTLNFTQKQVVLAQRAIENAVKGIRNVEGNKVTKIVITPVKDPSSVNVITEAKVAMSTEEVLNDTDTGKPEVFFKVDIFLQGTPKLESFKYGDFLNRYFEAAKINLSKHTLEDFLTNKDIMNEFVKGIVETMLASNTTAYTKRKYIVKLRDIYSKASEERKAFIKDVVTKQCIEAATEVLNNKKNRKEHDATKTIVEDLSIPNALALYPEVIDAVFVGNRSYEIEEALQETLKDIAQQAAAEKKEGEVDNAVRESLAEELAVKASLEKNLTAAPVKVRYGNYNYNFTFEIAKEPTFVNGRLSTIVKVNKDAGKKATGRVVGKALLSALASAQAGRPMYVS